MIDTILITSLPCRAVNIKKFIVIGKQDQATGRDPEALTSRFSNNLIRPEK
jgi:hypothetical protein